MMLVDEKVANLYHDLLRVVYDYSYCLTKNLTLTPPKINWNLRYELLNLLSRVPAKVNSFDTFVFPTLQFTPIRLNNDADVMIGLLSSLPSGAILNVASGYMNFPSFLINKLYQIETVTVPTAAPQANCFYNGSGLKKAIPTAYSLIEQDLYNSFHNSNQKLLEYNRKNWTFHAKGLWTGIGKFPQLTIIGSSNFGRRSYERDFESQLFLFTRNPKLQEKLHKEYNLLLLYSQQVNEQIWQKRRLKGVFNLKTGRWIRPFTKLIRSFL